MPPKRKRPKKANAKPTGRKPKLDQVLVAKLLPLLQQGHTIEIACKAVGIGDSTFHRWMDTGKTQEHGPYRDFWEKVTAARAICEVMLLDTLQKAARTDWRAAQWLLERLFGDRYADKSKFLMDLRGKFDHRHHGDSKGSIVIMMPSAIAQPRPQPKQINARETTPQPPPAP